MSRLAILGDADIEWVSSVVDIVESEVGRPWRNALDRLDDLQRARHGNAPRRFGAVVSAVQRLTGGRVKNAAAAREARSLVLGAPALREADRHARIIAAADQLGVTPSALEKLLWSDLPRERPVELPDGRPHELEVAAFANVAILQRLFRRAQAVTLRIADDPGPILRACRQRGLLATANLVDPSSTTDVVIVGPLALFHRTSVYGRALADLVPLLGELREFHLEVFAETQAARYSTEVESTRDAPLLLPAPPARLLAVPYPVAKLARALRRIDPTLALTPLPPPIVGATAILCADLLVERTGQRCYVEIAGFWTARYVRRRLAAYRAAGLDVIVCVDASGASDDLSATSSRDGVVRDDESRGGERSDRDGDAVSCADVLMFRKHADAEEIVARLQHRWGTLCT